MENASKALIIAGAILLSIVLITLGVLIIGRGQAAIDSTNIDDQVVSSWNQKWTKYEGKDVTGTTVNNLINEVISSNKIADGNGENEKVIFIYIGTKSSSNSNNKLVVKPKLAAGFTGDLNAANCYLPAQETAIKCGTYSCSQYAKATGKYEISTEVNKFGYISRITIKY